MTGIGLGGVYKYHSLSLNNVRRGLLERVCFRVIDGEAHSTPAPEKGFYRDVMEQVRRRLVAVTRPCRRMTRQEFVECYTGRKRMVYERAVQSLAARPLNKSDSYLSTFPKAEKIFFTAKPDPAPRVIQPRSPRYNVEIGRSLKKMEAALKEGAAELWGAPTIMKGYNASETGRIIHKVWSEFKRPVALSIDAVRFDQHVSEDALRFEHSVYLDLVLPHDRPKLRKILEMQITNRGFARTDEGDIDYEVIGRRMSGDMNTGMGNCLLMVTLFKQYLESIGVNGKLLNNGDDCVLIIEKHDLDIVNATLTPFFKRAGFVLTIEDPVDELEKIDFCQCHPVLGPHGDYVMVRDPRTAIDKDLTTQKDLTNPTVRKQWAHAIGGCELALGSGIPIWQQFGLMLLRDGKPGKHVLEEHATSGMAMMAKGMDSKATSVTPDTRVSFWKAFGILPDAQLVIETFYESVTLSSSVVDRTRSPIANYRLTFQ